MTRHHGAPGGRRGSWPSGWAAAAAAWSTSFAALHVFWAVGGSTGLATSAGRTLAEQRPTWFVVGGLCFTVAAVQAGRRRRPR